MRLQECIISVSAKHTSDVCVRSPGDEYVDWVGTSIDHFGGITAPYTKNLLPYAFEFADKVSSLLLHIAP